MFEHCGRTTTTMTPEDWYSISSPCEADGSCELKTSHCAYMPKAYPKCWIFLRSSSKPRRYAYMDKKSSCQLMAKECTLSTGKLPLGGLPGNICSVVRITDRPDMTSAGYHGREVLDYLIFQLL